MFVRKSDEAVSRNSLEKQQPPIEAHAGSGRSVERVGSHKIRERGIIITNASGGKNV
jgi:hypothetical protein